MRGALLDTPRRSLWNVLEAGNHEFFSIVQIFEFSPKIPQTTLDIYFTFWPSFAIFCLVSARFRRLTFYKICHFKSCVLQFRDKNKGLTENLLTKPKKISISFSKQFCDFICLVKGMIYHCLVKEVQLSCPNCFMKIDESSGFCERVKKKDSTDFKRISI